MFPAFPHRTGDGGRAMPFWSSLGRAEQVIQNVPAYAGFTPVELELDAFLERWIPGLTRDRLRVGLNWSGERATGYDADPGDVAEQLLTFVGTDAPRRRID
jgi:hypothetical protein